MLKPRDLQQRMLYRPLDQSVQLHCQRVSVEFNIRCSFSESLVTRVFQTLNCSTPIRDQAELIRLFGIWPTAHLSFVPCNGGAISAIFDCIVELTLALDRSFTRIPKVWTTSRTGRPVLQEATHPLMVPHNLHRWWQIGGLQENGQHTDYRVLRNLDMIDPTMQAGGPCGMTKAIANTTNYASRHDSIEHQWMTVAGFLTGRVGNYKDRVTYNRHVLDV